MTVAPLSAQSSARDILEAFEVGDCSPALYQQLIAPAVKQAAALNAYIIEPEASGGEQGTGPLAGLPVSIKDNIAVDGLPTTGGTPGFADLVLDEGPVVGTLRLAGAAFSGKTNLHELAFGISGTNAHKGPARNPFDERRLAGGSSSGAAVTVALGAAAVAVGTDTGGSCRVPAAHCGIVGFRPTTGRYPAGNPGRGFIELSPSRDTLGLLARSAADIALIDDVIASPSPAGSLPKPEEMILGVVSPASFGFPPDPAVAEVFERSVQMLADRGARLTPVDLSDVLALDDACGFTIAVYETYQSLKRQSQAVPGLTMDAFIASIASADVRGLIAMQHGAEAIPKAVYLQAVNEKLPALQEAFDLAFDQTGCQALLYPTCLFRPPPLDVGETFRSGDQELPTFPAYSATTRPDSMAGQPSITLPCGDTGGLPVGLQLVGARGEDATLLKMAQVVEALLPPRPVPE